MRFILLTLVFLFSHWAYSQELSSAVKACVIDKLDQIDPQQAEKPLSELIKACQQGTSQSKKPQSNVQKRIAKERAERNDPRVILPHKRSYFIPVSLVETPNQAPYQDLPIGQQQLDQLEAKFQISFKALLTSQIFAEKDSLFMGFTIQSYWQMYNSELSSPFRETNYQPEIFYFVQNDWQIGSWNNRGMMFGIEHQSNGRTQLLSRSWNRIFANFIFEKDNWVVVFRPWYRLPEDLKLDPAQPQGDDNPDIEKYMGHFELRSVYSWGDQHISLMLRNNLRKDNRGAAQLDWSFPLGLRFKGYVQYFNGYGESLIDYNHSIQRIGMGILLTDFF